MPYFEARPQARPFECRFARPPADGKPDVSCGEICLYEAPGCAGCPYAVRAERICKSAEDPMKSAIVHGWIHGLPGISK
jgi:hypothetical protein